MLKQPSLFFINKRKTLCVNAPERLVKLGTFDDINYVWRQYNLWYSNCWYFNRPKVICKSSLSLSKQKLFLMPCYCLGGQWEGLLTGSLQVQILPNRYKLFALSLYVSCVIGFLTELPEAQYSMIANAEICWKEWMNYIFV